MIFIILTIYAVSKKMTISSFLLFLIGLVLIVSNVFLVKTMSNSYFGGSDASSYYEKAKSYDGKYDVIYSMDTRYVGYIIYQQIASYPFLENSRLASVLIKFTSWTILFLAFLSLKSNINYSIGLVNKLVILSMSLWLSIYNFRDIIILSCLMFIISYFLSKKKIDKIKLMMVLFVLFYFRFFYVFAILGAWLLSIVMARVMKLYYLRRIKVFIFIIAGVYFYIITSGVFSKPSDIILVSKILNNSTNDFSFNMSNHFVSLLTGMFAGNPIDFLFNYFTIGDSRAFTITFISAFLMSGIYFYSYVFFFFFMFMILVFNFKTFSMVQLNRKILITVLSLVSFVFFVLLFYTTYFGSVQERIRVPLLIIISLVSSLVGRIKVFKLGLLYSLVFAIITTVLVFFLKSV